MKLASDLYGRTTRTTLSKKQTETKIVKKRVCKKNDEISLFKEIITACDTNVSEKGSLKKRKKIKIMKKCRKK